VDEEFLYNNIKEFCKEIHNYDSYGEQFSKGWELIVKYKEEGGTREKAFETVYRLHLKYMVNDEDEQKMNLVDDLLDCIYPYIGNKKLWIW